MKKIIMLLLILASCSSASERLNQAELLIVEMLDSHSMGMIKREKIYIKELSPSVFQYSYTYNNAFLGGKTRSTSDFTFTESLDSILQMGNIKQEIFKNGVWKDVW